MGSHDYDLVVIGAGIIGACVAHAFHERGGGSILLIDQGRVGGGASDFSVGFDAVESQVPAHRQLAIRSRALYAQMASEVPEAHVHRVPTYWIVDERRASTFAENFRSATGEGTSLHWLARGSAERRAFEETYGVAASEEVCVEHDDGYAYPGETARGIVQRLLRIGALKCWEGVEVVAVERCDEGCQITVRDRRALRARRAILAVGPWLRSPAFAAFAGDTRVKKIGTLLIDKKPDPSAAAVVHYEHGAFLVPLHRRSRWVFSFTLDVWDEPADMVTTLRPAEHAQGCRLLEMLVPGLARHVGGTQTFYDAYSDDRMPRVYSPGDVPALHVVTAASGAGYRIAPALAEQVVARL